MELSCRLFLSVVKGCMKFVYIQFGILLLIVTMVLRDLFMQFVLLLLVATKGFKDMINLWLKVNSIRKDYTRLFDEMDGIHKEISTLVDTVQSLEHKEGIRLALLMSIYEFAKVKDVENINKALQDCLAVHTSGGSTREELSKDVQQVLYRVEKLQTDMAGKDDELVKLLPVPVANLVYRVTIKPVLDSNLDGLEKAVSSLQEAISSLERKQNASLVRVLEFCRFATGESKTIDKKLFTEDAVLAEL